MRSSPPLKKEISAVAVLITQLGPAASGKEDSGDLRNELIFKLLYETGMRIGELLHLRFSDYDLPEPFQKVGNIYLVDRGNLDDEDRQLKTGERIILLHYLENLKISGF